MPWFLSVNCTSLLKTLREKEKLLVLSNFSFSHSVFYLFGELSSIPIKSEIVDCNFFKFGGVQKFVIWERVNTVNPKLCITDSSPQILSPLPCFDSEASLNVLADMFYYSVYTIVLN